MTHETLQAFGEKFNLIKEYRYWKLLIRNRSTTLGNCVLIIKEDIREWGLVPVEANAELAMVIKELELALKAAFNYDKINYLMLMMKDPQVHFHVFPRYAEAKTFEDVEWIDVAWPGAKDLLVMKCDDISQEYLDKVKQEIQKHL